MRLLVVEDEEDLAGAVALGLRREGYAVDLAGTVGEALERLTTTAYDLVCLDLNLPDGDGREVCRSLRASGSVDGTRTRVLMLTARTSLDDRVAGLDDGADDYLVKPFGFPELTARVRALLRRDLQRGSGLLRVGALELDAARFEARRHDRPLGLTPKEFALLRYLMLHSGDVLTPERLLEHVWDGEVDPFSNTVRVTVSNLRRKLAAADPDRRQPIETVVGRGYRLSDPA
ncbi:MAG: response regulator transcription factor [Acidimicrobiales bacterium]|nr:response regulator transcription factor [Acidimicrobiales bacterium]